MVVRHHAIDFAAGALVFPGGRVEDGDHDLAIRAIDCPNPDEVAPEALAFRIAKFPPAGVTAIKRRINDISLPPLADVRTDGALFQQTIVQPRAQARTKELLDGGMQTRGTLEREFADALGRLTS